METRFPGCCQSVSQSSGGIVYTITASLSFCMVLCVGCLGGTVLYTCYVCLEEYHINFRLICIL